MFSLTENQITAIMFLAKYKYLTASQFVRLGLYKKRGYLTNSLKVLLDMKRPLIAKHDFNPVGGRLESFYYLTKYGKKFLIEELAYDENSIKAPKCLTLYLKDYFHRRYTIDFHIYFSQWIESNNGEINFLNYYFDKAGNNRSNDTSKYVTALNKIKLKGGDSFIPDINCMFTLENQKYLYLFEQHNGKDSKRLFEQLCIHIIAISENVLSEQYILQKPHMVVVVCEFESVKRSVIQRLKSGKHIELYNKFFIFKTNSELQEDFYENWTLINGEQTNFIVS